MEASDISTEACGAGDLATSNPEGMGPTPVEDRGQHREGCLHVLIEWRQKGARFLAPDETTERASERACDVIDSVLVNCCVITVPVSASWNFSVFVVVML